MKVVIEALNSPPNWQYPETTGITLRVYANTPFITYNGQVVLAGGPNTPNSYYLEVPCDITGGNVLYIEGFEIDSTEDSPTNRTATYTAWLYANDIRIGNVPFLAGFGVPALLDPLTQLAANQTWTSLTLHRDSKNPPPRQGVYDIGQVEYLITQALAELRMASETQVGMVALQDDPVDPQFPIALGPNSPGVAKASGLATLVAGEKLVASNAVTATCGIVLTGQDNGASGTLWVSDKVVGVSFTIASSGQADDGVVFWEIIEP